MNISINISLKALQMSMWGCFTNGRTLPADLEKDGYEVKFTHSDNWFNYEYMKGTKQIIKVSIDRHSYAMESANPYNYSAAFFNAWCDFCHNCRTEFIGNPEVKDLATNEGSVR
jgi:hypothetical protein